MERSVSLHQICRSAAVGERACKAHDSSGSIPLVVQESRATCGREDRVSGVLKVASRPSRTLCWTRSSLDEEGVGACEQAGAV
jgi:hypothetical protein